VVSKLQTTPEACVYIDDKAVNLEEPRKMGMRTILIDEEPNEWVDIMVKQVHDVGKAIDQFLSESPTEMGM
jgi:FMN phosphatase YigB (HAD superfamily)